MNEQQRRIKRSQGLADALKALEAERSRVEEAIEAAGRRRQDALEQAALELERIGDLAMDALDAGSSATDIVKKADMSRRTLYKMLDARGYKRHRDE